MKAKDSKKEIESLWDVEIEVRTVKPGNRYAHPLYDEYKNMVLEAHTPISGSILNHLVSSGIERLYYDFPKEKEEENTAGLDVDKNVINGELESEVLEHTRDLFEDIREVYNYSPERGIPKESIIKSRKLVDNILTDIEKSKDAIFNPIASLKDMDDYIYQHSTNVSVLAALVGSRLGYKRETRSSMGLGGLFHDIGKSSMSKEIVNKFKELNEEELDIIKEHPNVGYKLIEKNPYMHELEKRILLLHHERADGGGFPFGFSSDHYTNSIPKEVRLVSICNVFILLTFKKPGQEPLSSREALRRMLNMVYAPFKKVYHFIPADFRDFIRAAGFMLNRGNFFLGRGDIVRLNTGEVAVIEEMNRLYPLNPRIMILRNSQLQPLRRQIHVDMLKDYNSHIANIIERKK